MADSRRAKLVYYAVDLLLILVIISLVQTDVPEVGSFYDKENEECQKIGSDNFSEVASYPDSQGERFQKSAFQGVPSYEVRVNRFGLRDENLSRSPSDNETRIVVIGDSFTYGVGLNESQRFTEGAERILEDRTEASINIVNAGQPEWGMKEYYESFKHEIVSLNPDMVVVAFYGLDSVSQDKYRKWRLELREKHGCKGLPESREMRKELASYNIRYLKNSNWENSQMRIYGNKIADLAESRDIKPFFFYIDPLGESFEFVPGEKQYNSTHYRVEAWAADKGYALADAPGKLDQNKYVYPDHHYNAKGNRVLARTLSEHLRSFIGAIKD